MMFILLVLKTGKREAVVEDARGSVMPDLTGNNTLEPKEPAILRLK